MNCIAADEIRLEVKQGRAIDLAALELRRAAHLMLAEIDEMLVVDARVFNMRDERAAPNHRPDAIGQAGDDPLDRGPQGDKICRNHAVVAGDLSLRGAAPPAPRIPAAIPIIRTRCEDLRSRGRGGSQRAAPEGAPLPAVAGISSCKGKGDFSEKHFPPK